MEGHVHSTTSRPLGELQCQIPSL